MKTKISTHLLLGFQKPEWKRITMEVTIKWNIYERDKLIHIVIIHIKNPWNTVNKYFHRHFKNMDRLPFLANYKMSSAAWSSFEIKYFEV